MTSLGIDKSAAVFAMARAVADLSLEQMAQKTGLPVSVIRAIEDEEQNTDPADRVSYLVAIESCGIKADVSAGAVWLPINESKTAYLRGRLVHAARAGLGMTQKDLAAAAQVGVRTISNIEAGDVETTTAVYDAVHGALARRNAVIFRERDNMGVGLHEEGKVPPQQWVFPEGRPWRDDADRMESTMGRYLAEMQGENLERPEFQLLRVAITDSDPLIWREIAIPKNASFADLHRAIQYAFGWHNAHLHHFDCGIKIGVSEQSEETGEIKLSGDVVDERLVFVENLAGKTKSFTYVYDEGDHWEHTIVVGRTMVPNGRKPIPFVLDGSMAGPVEDAGGIEAYNDLAHSLRVKSVGADKRRWLDRVGYKHFDPDEFDIKKINRALAKASFSIPATTKENWRRLDSVEIDMPGLDTQDEPSMVGYPETISVQGVEPFGEVAYNKEGHGDRLAGGVNWSSSKLNSRVSMRIISELSMITEFLDCSPDVASFETMPVAVRYLDENDDEGHGVVDVSITYTDGTQQNVQMINSIEGATFYAKLFAAAHLDVMLCGERLYDTPQARNLHLVAHARMGHWPPTDALRSFAAELASGDPVPFTEAVSRLRKTDVWQGILGLPTNEEYGPIRAVEVLIGLGLVGLDFSAAKFEEAMVGPLRLTKETLSLKVLVEQSSPMGVMDGRLVDLTKKPVRPRGRSAR